MECSCDGWKESMFQIDGALVLAAIHGVGYAGRKFKYCPWCGELLRPDELGETLGGYIGETNITP